MFSKKKHIHGGKVKRSLLRTILSLCFLCITALNSYALETPFFSGYAGILGDFKNVEDSTTFTPDLKTQTFFSGQLDFGGSLILRGEFYLSTNNLIENNIFLEPANENAKFRIQEVSATAKVNAITFTNYFSVFLGNFEPIGSDIFLQRQFGIKSITSKLTESWHGIAGASIYPFYGAGFSYTMRFEKPMIIGANLYWNLSLADIVAGTVPDKAFNIDLRFACIYPYFSFDLCGGFGLHLEKEDSEGNKVFVLVNEADLHAGLAMLIGNRYTSSLFVQAGIGELRLTADAKNDFQLHNIYFLLEPRFVMEFLQLNIGVFNIPQNATNDMIYLKDIGATNNVLGTNVSVFTDRLFIGNTNFTLGVHGTATIKDISKFEDLKKIKEIYAAKGMGLTITPFVTIPIFGGTFTAHCSLDFFKLTLDPQHCYKVACGFKTAL